MKQQEFANIGKIINLLKGIHIHPAYAIIPILLSVSAAVFEGGSIGMLIPLLHGFIEQDYTFVKEAPVLSTFLAVIPTTIQQDNKSLFAFLLAVFVVAVVLKNILRYSAQVCLVYFSSRSIHHLRKNVFGRYMMFGKLYFDMSNVGYHNTILTDFTTQAFRPLALMDKYVSALFSLIAYLVLMSMISLNLTIMALPLFFILHFSVSFIIKKIHAASKDMAERGKEIGKKSIEILSTIPLVKAYSTERSEQNKFALISDTRAKLDLKAATWEFLVEPIHEMITLFAVLGLFIGMLYFLINERTGSTSSFIVYFYAVLNAATKFRTLTHMRTVLAKATGPLNEIIPIFDNEKKYILRSGTTKFNGLSSTIDFKNLSFSYPDGNTIFSDLTVSFTKGNMTAIVGSTGAGKTTLINLIMRFYDCPKGTLFIDGVDIHTFSIASLLSHIALVSQDTMLLHDTLRANIAYGLENISDDQILEATEQARLSDFIQNCEQGLDTIVGDRGVKLSGGEKQRLAIARALLKDADILILDEATSALDSETEQLVQQAIDHVVKDRTAIVIAHRLSTIKNADHILVLENGKCIEQGSVEKLLAKKGRFEELWKKQQF